jgi:hypothetical protein
MTQAHKQSNAQISLLNFSANIGTLFGRGTSTHLESLPTQVVCRQILVPFQGHS